MSKTVADSGQMRRLAAKLERLADEYQHLYEYELYGTIVDDIRRAYKGVDTDAMIHGLEEFRNDFSRLRYTVYQYAAYLRKAAAKYDDMQAELAAQAAQLTKDV